MPGLPTTRNGRFLFRAAKYRRLRFRQHNLWSFFAQINGEWKYQGRTKLPNNGPKMGPSGLVKRPAGPLVPLIFNPFDVWVTAEGRGNPPHVKLATFEWHPPLSDVFPYGWRQPLAGYHRKRVKACRRHPKAMNALQRRVWGANVFYHKEGIFPDADPLGRTPNESNPPATPAGYYPQGDWPTISPRDV